MDRVATRLHGNRWSCLRSFLLKSERKFARNVTTAESVKGAAG